MCHANTISNIRVSKSMFYAFASNEQRGDINQSAKHKLNRLFQRLTVKQQQLLHHNIAHQITQAATRAVCFVVFRKRSLESFRPDVSDAPPRDRECLRTSSER